MSRRERIFPFAALALLACAPSAEPYGESVRPIIGGVPSSDFDYPATGVLIARITDSQYGQMVCTGTLIAPDVVLTAAHCTIDFFGGTLPLEHYFSFSLDVSSFGQNDTTLPPRSTKVRKLLPHPDFDINQLGGGGAPPPTGLGDFKDIGLLFLDARVDDVQPAYLTEVDDDASILQGSSVAIAGYGVRQNGGMEAGIKYHADSIINELGAAEMQIGDLPPVPQKCHGDSGGPTFLEIDDGLSPSLRIIGVTSRAYDESDCGKGGVDTRIHTQHAWISDMMIAHCSDGTRLACENGGAPARPGVPGADSGVVFDAGFIDTGVTPPIDAGAPPDAEMIVRADAAPGDASSAPNAFRNGRETDRGCGCAATAGNGRSSWILIFAALIVLRRRF